MNRPYNFSAGPAALPLEVLQKVQAELLDWQNFGASILEISHRSPEFMALAKVIEANCRELLSIPDNYQVLFMHAGGQGQFSIVPMHYLTSNGYGAYIKTGSWSEISAVEAKRFGRVKVIADSANANYDSIPVPRTWQDFKDADYLYYVDNETIHGVEFGFIPETGEVPLICDMFSNLLSRPVDVSRYGLIFACVQKNLGPAGLTLVIIRDDLLQREPAHIIPKVLDYRLQAEKKSLVNTPPIFPWYVTGLVLDWVKQQGGVKVMATQADQRAKRLYNFIDGHDFYQNSVDLAARSRMNVIFHLNDESLNDNFLQAAKQAGLLGLKGHRLLGGMRASLYNSMPMAGVEALIDFMDDFAASV